MSITIPVYTGVVPNRAEGGEAFSAAADDFVAWLTDAAPQFAALAVAAGFNDTALDAGEWTPQIWDNLSGGNQGNPTFASGRWARVGNVVHVIGELVKIDKTGMSGSVLAIRGLPFPPAGQTGVGSVYLSVTSGTDPLCVLASVTYAALIVTRQQNPNNSFGTGVTPLLLHATDSTILVACSYRVA